MKFPSYSLALSDLALTGIILFIVIVGLCFFGDWVCAMFDPCEREFEEPDSDPEFEQELTEEAKVLNSVPSLAFCDQSRLEETGIAAEIAHLPAGSQLVEIDTAGMLTPPGAVIVHEYRWTGSAIEFVKTCPLHEFDFRVPGARHSDAAQSPFEPLGHGEWPELKAAREQFFHTRDASAPAAK